MSLQARAEQGLLEALAKPRKSAATVKVIGRGEIEIPDKEVLRKWRKNYEKQQLLRSQEEDHDAVASLNHQPIEPALRHKEFPKLAQKRIDKRTTHDLTVKQFESTLVEISDALEVKVIEASRTVQQGIGACDQTVADIFAELNQDLWLVTKDHQFVLDQWTKIDLECIGRKEQIAKYGDQLEEIEGSRASMVAGELKALVETLTSTAFKSPTDIERLVEAEAFELNTVLIVNRQSHAELLSLMEKQHIIVALEARTNWEIRQAAWRQLRHDRCVREFHEELNSKAFTNPPKRIAIFEKMKQAQAIRHETRLEKLNELMKMKLPSFKIVEQVTKGFESLNTTEDTAIGKLHGYLEDIRSERKCAAEARREALRAELHQYGALEDEPLLEAHALVIEDVLVNKPQLESFFRSAGGLKPELKELMSELRDWTLIYDHKLQPTIKRVQVLICGLEVPRVLESQGKSGMRSNLIDSLERMKNATKADVPSMLPVLLSQVSELLSVTVLDPLLLNNLAEAHEDLLTIISDAEIKMGSIVSGIKSPSASGGAGVAATERSSRAKSILSNGQARSKTASTAKRSMGGTSRRSAIMDQPEVNMLEVRAVQKRLMMLMRTSDLDEEFQTELRAILQSLYQKSRCNAAIDAVVTSESIGPLASRDSEYVSMTDQAVRFLERNTSHLHEMSMRLSSFFKAVAVILEDHALKDEDIDITAEDALLELADEFKDEDEAREAKVTLFSNKLKHAADERELEEAYEAVLAMLDKIDASYYKYHATATQVAGLHPKRICDEASSYMAKLCSAIGLKYGSGSSDAPSSESPVPTLQDDGGLVSTQAVSPDPKMMVGNDSHNLIRDNDENDGSLVQTIFSIPGSKTQYPVDQTPELIVKNIMKPPPNDEEEPSVDGSVAAESVYVGENESNDQQEASDAARSQLENDEESQGSASPSGRPMSPPEDKSFDGSASKQEYDNASLTSNTSQQRSVPWFVEGFPPPPPEEGDEGEGAGAGADEEGQEEGDKDNKENVENSEEYLNARDAAFIELDTKVLDTLSPDQRAEYEDVFKAVKDYRIFLVEKAIREKEEARIALYAAPPPNDPDGTPVALSVSLPQDAMIQMISTLRNSLIEHSEKCGEKRLRFGDDLCHERQTDFTEELEERLRLHWPRKGRVEVKIRQVREGQLIAHRQRAQRHGRVVREKCAKQHLDFEIKVAKIAERYKYISDQIKALEAILPAQESLAALQGLEGKCRKLVQGFREECAESLQELHISTTVEPNKLYFLSATLLKSTNLFGFDGDYSEYEYQELQAQLAELNGEIEHSVKHRLLQLDGLIPRQEAAFAGEVQFMKRFELALQELSLREAIGMKYGAPRRNAQERLRTEQTCDANSAAAVDVLLEQLEVLCKDCKVYVDLDKGLINNKKDGNSNDSLYIDSRLTIPRSAVIRENLRTLRSLLFRRASYLEFLPKPELIDHEKEVPMESLSKKDEAALRRVVPQFVPTLAETMQQSIDMMEEKCRSETRKLYEDEGKADTLGPAGVPDALQEWLTKCRLGILGDEGHRDKSRRRLRAQVEKIELLLAKEPVPSNPNVLGAGAAMVEESSVRSLKAANKFIKTCEKNFQSRLDVWNAAKAKHQSLLRPQMGRPDAKKELDELTRKECERSEEVLQAIQKVREDIIQGQIQHAQLFVSTIVEQTSSALGLIDTLVLIDDLGYLPGDELIEKKRKSLKRLRKLQRAKGDEVGEGGDVQDCYEKPDGRHCSVRTWPVLPIQQLTQLFEKHNVPITDNNANESTPTPRPDNAADDVEGQTEDGAHVEAGGGGEGERKVTDWISGLIEEFGQEGPNSVVTTAHRQVIRSRDSNWERFLNDLDEKFTRLDAHFGKLQHEEVAWKETWLGHIKNLVRDNQFADGS